MKNRMRVLRAENDWTQAQLAAMIGVSRQAIVAVENGKYEPALPLAFRIARAFGKNLEEVFIWENEDRAPGPAGPTGAPDPSKRKVEQK
jgi:putative transcriptional regulator